MENKQTPLVSVVTPTYNSGNFIAQAIQSVLEQTYQHHEVIVIDDGSTDETKDVLRGFNSYIKYLYQENRGPSAARNAGIRAARGKYICFLDADDLWVANKLEVQLAFMEHHCDIGLVFSDFEEFDADRILRGSFLAEKVFRYDIVSEIPIREAFMKLVMENFIPTSTIMVRKECFEKVGLFDESLRSVEDRDMLLRIAAHFGIACIPLVLSKKRVHGSNISGDRELANRSLIKVLEKNRRLFSNLAPATVWRKRLAYSYLGLGYQLLYTNQKKEARQVAIQSLTYVVTTGAFRLILLTFMGWPVIQFLRRIKRELQGQGKIVLTPFDK
jgi:glycosyltransferase involved in cell wall biosynthesis